LHLSAPVRVAYEAVSRAGRVPALTTAVDGLCRVCRARLPSEVVEAVVRGALVICRGCERLLCPTEGR
jgi:flavoprotein